MGRRFKRNFRSAVIKIFSVIVHGKEEILLGIMNVRLEAKHSCSLKEEDEREEEKKKKNEDGGKRTRGREARGGTIYKRELE
jgi:hypothetical protein